MAATLQIHQIDLLNKYKTFSVTLAKMIDNYIIYKIKHKIQAFVAVYLL